MRLRSWIVCLGATATLLVAVAGATGAAGSGATRTAQSLQQAWVRGADVVWAWTQDESGPARGGGAQGIELTTDGGLH